MNIRVSFDVDVTNETTYSDVVDTNGVHIKVPVTAENALAWYLYAFDASEDNYTPGFVTNTKVEVIPEPEPEPMSSQPEILGDILERALATHKAKP